MLALLESDVFPFCSEFGIGSGLCFYDKGHMSGLCRRGGEWQIRSDAGMTCFDDNANELQGYKAFCLAM